MYLSVVVGVIFFMLAVILSQRIMLNANARLSDADKLKIAEFFARRNFNYSVFIFSLIVIFLLALYLLPEYAVVIVVTYTMLLIVYFISKLLLNVKKLKELNAPNDYIRSVIVNFCLFFGGAAIAVVIIVVGLNQAD